MGGWSQPGLRPLVGEQGGGAAFAGSAGVCVTSSGQPRVSVFPVASPLSPELTISGSPSSENTPRFFCGGQRGESGH